MAVHQFAGRVKVSCVTCSFGNNVKQDGSQVGETPVTEELWPVSGFRIQGCVRNDVVGQLNLVAV